MTAQGFVSLVPPRALTLDEYLTALGLFKIEYEIGTDAYRYLTSPCPSFKFHTQRYAFLRRMVKVEAGARETDAANAVEVWLSDFQLEMLLDAVMKE